MLRFVLAAISLGLVAAQLPNIHDVCTENTQFTEADVIHFLGNLCDRNHDGHYTEAEWVVCFSEIVGKDLSFPEPTILTMDYEELKLLANISGYHILRDSFVDAWHNTFHDSLTFAGATFDAFDQNGDGVWIFEDLDNILSHMRKHDLNHDGLIQHADMEDFFNHLRGASCVIIG